MVIHFSQYFARGSVIDYSESLGVLSFPSASVFKPDRAEFRPLSSFKMFQSEKRKKITCLHFCCAHRRTHALGFSIPVCTDIVTVQQTLATLDAVKNLRAK